MIKVFLGNNILLRVNFMDNNSQGPINVWRSANNDCNHFAFRSLCVGVCYLGTLKTKDLLFWFLILKTCFRCTRRDQLILDNMHFIELIPLFTGKHFSTLNYFDTWSSQISGCIWVLERMKRNESLWLQIVMKMSFNRDARKIFEKFDSHLRWANNAESLVRVKALEKVSKTSRAGIPRGN